MTIFPISKFGNQKFIVSPTPGLGNYTTVTAALTAASSGDTLFIRDGTYVEDLTLKAGVNLTSFDAAGSTFGESSGSVTIQGKLTASFNGTVAISGITFSGNGDYVFVMTGANPTNVYFNECNFYSLNHTAFTSSAASGQAFFDNTTGFVDGNSITLLDNWSHGLAQFNFCDFQTNAADASSFPATISGGGIKGINSRLFFYFSATGGGFEFTDCYTLGHTIATGAFSNNSGVLFYPAGGTLPAMTVGAGCTAQVVSCLINTSATNPFTGAGTIFYGDCVFTTPNPTNVSTENYYPWDVKQGGTGVSTLTSDGVLVGNGTGNVVVTSAGTTGQFLGGNTGSAPTFQSLPASSISITGDTGGALTGSSFTLTGGTTGLTFAGAGTTETLGGSLIVANGGTGATTLTGVLIGNGTSAVTAQAPLSVAHGGTGDATLTAHGLLLGQGTSAVTAVSPGGTPGIPLIAQGASSDPVYGTAVVAGGGTGVATFANTSALLATGTSSTGSLQNIASVATGSILTSAGTSTLPTWTLAKSAGASWVWLSTQTASNVGAINFNDTNYSNYALMISGVFPITNNVTLQCQYTINSGLGYINSGYQSGFWTYGFNSTAIGNASATSVVSITGSQSNVANGATVGMSGILYFFGFNTPALPFACRGDTTFQFLGGSGIYVGWNAAGNSTTGANGIQITFSSGNISTGTFSWYGIRT